MAKYSQYFSRRDISYRAQTSAPQVIWSDQLEAQYRELQELREWVREAEERSIDRLMITTNNDH
jgi:hypothetical protein